MCLLIQKMNELVWLVEQTCQVLVYMLFIEGEIGKVNLINCTHYPICFYILFSPSRYQKKKERLTYQKNDRRRVIETNWPQMKSLV